MAPNFRLVTLLERAVELVTLANGEMDRRRATGNESKHFSPQLGWVAPSAVWSLVRSLGRSVSQSVGQSVGRSVGVSVKEFSRRRVAYSSIQQTRETLY